MLKITLAEAYEELTERRDPVFGVCPLIDLINKFIGEKQIKTDNLSLHLYDKNVEHWWQLFYSICRHSIIGYCNEKNKSEKHQKAVEFFIFLVNFLEITYDTYNRWYLTSFSRPNFLRWINHFKNVLAIHTKKEKQRFNSNLENNEKKDNLNLDLSIIKEKQNSDDEEDLEEIKKNINNSMSIDEKEKKEK